MKIFISYNRQTKAITKALVEDVEALGHTVWFDHELSGGQAWWDQILSTIRCCDVFVFVLDPAALNSVACKRECGYAADLRKLILPILVSDGVSTNLLPPLLSQIEFVDYREQDRTAALRLARAFSAVPAPAPLPDPLPLPPEAPISYLGSLAAKVEATSLLTYEEQSVLVVDLKRGLRDPETADDTQTLLKMFRKRHDLLARIAEEIDELFEGLRETSSARGAPPNIEKAVTVVEKKAEPSTTPAAPPPESAKVLPEATEAAQLADEECKLEEAARTAAEKRKVAEAAPASLAETTPLFPTRVAPPKSEQATEPINREQVVIDSPGFTPPAVTTTRTERLAVWSLVLGLGSLVLFVLGSRGVLGLVLAVSAIVCGHWALSKIRKQSHLQGRRLAIAGLVMGYLPILILIFAILAVAAWGHH